MSDSKFIKNEKLMHLSDEDIERLMDEYYNQKASVKDLLEKYNIDEKPRNFVAILPPEMLEEKCPICQSNMYAKRKSRQDRSRPKIPFCVSCGHILDSSCTCEACLAERNARYRRYEEGRWIDVRTKREIDFDYNEYKRKKREQQYMEGKYNVETVYVEGPARPGDKNVVKIDGKLMRVDRDISRNVDENEAYIFNDYSKKKRENPLKTLLLKYYRNNEIKVQSTESLSFQNRIYLGALLRHTTTEDDRIRLKSLFSIGKETGKQLASLDMEKRILIALYLPDYIVIDEDCRLDYYDDRDRFTVGFLGRITEYKLNLIQADKNYKPEDDGTKRNKCEQDNIRVFPPNRKKRRSYTLEEIMYPKGPIIRDGYDLMDAYSLWCATVLYDAIDYVYSYTKKIEVEYVPKISDMKLYKGIFRHYSAAQFWWMVDVAWERTDKTYQANNQRRRKLIERKFISNIRAVYTEIKKGELEVGVKDLKTCDRNYLYNDFLFNEVLHIGDKWFYEQADVLHIIDNMPKQKYIDEFGEEMDINDYWLFCLWKMESECLFHG